MYNDSKNIKTYLEIGTSMCHKDQQSIRSTQQPKKNQAWA